MSKRNDYDYFDLDNFDDGYDSRDYRRRQPQRRKGSYNSRPAYNTNRRRRNNKKRTRNRIIIVSCGILIIILLVIMISSVFKGCFGTKQTNAPVSTETKPVATADTPKANDKKVLMIGRITTLAVAVIAFFIAWDPNSSIMGLVSDAWAGLGSAFGPLVVCALFWKRTNLPGAVAGIVSGGLFVIIWDYLPIAGGQTPYAATGIYSLLLGFFISLACIVLVSLCTKAPEQEILDEFDAVKNYVED